MTIPRISTPRGRRLRNSSGSRCGRNPLAYCCSVPIFDSTENGESINLSPNNSGLAAEADEVVKLKQVRPRLDVFACLREPGDGVSEVLERLRVAVRAAAVHVIAPLLNFPRRTLG